MNEAAGSKSAPCLSQKGAASVRRAGIGGRAFSWVTDRGGATSFWLVTLSTLSMYLLTMPPHLTTGLAGTYVTGAYYAGIGHPPGYPLWTLYAWAFTAAVPFGNIAWRVAFSSAAAGALTSGLLALCIYRMGAPVLAGLNPPGRLAAADEERLKIVCSYASASALAFSPSFWECSIGHGPDAFGLLLLAGSLAILQNWFFENARLGVLLGAVLLYGAAVANSLWLFVAAPGLLILVALRDRKTARDFALLIGLSLLTATLGDWFTRQAFNRSSLIPGAVAALAQLQNLWTVYVTAGFYGILVAVLCSMGSGRVLSNWWRALLLCAAFTIPFLSFFYSAVASMTNPPVNWGYPRSLQGFVHLISRGQYESVRPVENVAVYLDQVAHLLPDFVRGYGWIFSLPAFLSLLSMRWLASSVRRWFCGLAGVFLCVTLLLLALLNPPADPSAIIGIFFAPAYLLLTFLTGVGLMLAGTYLGTRRR